MPPLPLRAAPALRQYHRWLLPVAALLTLAGYFGPWVAHQAAGLAILGLDLGELVKFLYPVQQGDIRLWREGFYLPLVAVSVSLSLNAFRREPNAQDASFLPDSPAFGWPIRIAFLLLAIASALNLLPPAWSPGIMLEPEFRQQLAALLLCLGLAALSPLAALLLSPLSLFGALGNSPKDALRRGCLRRAVWLVALTRGLSIIALAAAAIYFPLFQFRWILPTLADLYGRAPRIGWGPALMTLGLAGILVHGLGDIYSFVSER